MAERDDYADNDLPPSPADWVQSGVVGIGRVMVVFVVAYFVAAVAAYLLLPAR